MGLAITVYMVPFILLQLFSGSISQLITGRLTALLGFTVYGAASLGCARFSVRQPSCWSRSPRRACSSR